MKIRDKLYKLATRKVIDIKVYKDFRNILTNRIRRAKANYYEDEFRKTSLNIKKTWMTINSVIRKNKHNQNIQILNEDGTKVPDSEVPTKFVNYFTNIATNCNWTFLDLWVKSLPMQTGKIRISTAWGGSHNVHRYITVLLGLNESNKIW